MKVGFRSYIPKSPLTLSLAYAFLPSFRLLGVALSIADLLLFICLLSKLYTFSKHKVYSLRNPLIKHSFIFIIISLITFLASSIFTGSINYVNSLLILLRPFLFLCFLEFYFCQRKPLTKVDYRIFLRISTVLLVIFSLIVLSNVGFQFSANNIWSYSPFTRLVGLRGVILGGDGIFAGNDSVNFSLFVCFISLMHFSFPSRSDNSFLKFISFILGIFVFFLSSLCLSKSSYVFVALLFLVFLIRKLFNIGTYFKVKKYLLFQASLVLSLLFISLSSGIIMDYVFPRLNSISITSLIDDPSSQARLSLVSEYISTVSFNPFYLITGFGTGSLPYYFGTPHFEGLFPTIAAENGIIMISYLLFIFKLLFFPFGISTSSDSFEARILSYAFVPFVFVSVFSSLTLFSSLLYPLIMTLSYSLYSRDRLRFTVPTSSRSIK